MGNMGENLKRLGPRSAEHQAALNRQDIDHAKQSGDAALAKQTVDAYQRDGIGEDGWPVDGYQWPPKS